MPSLFIVMLGGRHKRANTEVHDVVLAVGDSLQEVYLQLKNAWFGELQGLHIDAWAKINGVQFEQSNYRICFSNVQPSSSEQKLFLINLGGYDSREFGELHRYVLVVAQNPIVAKQRGKQHFAQHWKKTHTDRVLEVDDCIAIDQIHGRYVQLIEEDFEKNYWENSYINIP